MPAICPWGTGAWPRTKEALRGSSAGIVWGREVAEKRLQGIPTALKKAAQTDTRCLPSPGLCTCPGTPARQHGGWTGEGRDMQPRLRMRKPGHPQQQPLRAACMARSPSAWGSGGGGILEAIAAAGGPGQTRAGKATCPELLLEILVKKCLGHTWAHSYSSIPEGPPLLGKRRGSGS